MIVLALLVGISGCFVPYRDDGRGHRYDRSGYDRSDRDARYADTDRDPGGRDCWREGSNVVCRRGR